MIVAARGLAVLAAFVLATLSCPLSAQQSVVVAWVGSGSPDPRRQEAFERSLRSRGVAPIIEARFAHGKLERLDPIASELVARKPDLILASDAISTSALKKATADIPIVMAGVSDPVGLRFVESLARPGGNITGLSSPFGDEFSVKWLELAAAVRPDARDFALLWNPQIPAARQRHAHIVRAAERLGVRLASLEVRQEKDLHGALAEYRRAGASGLIVDSAPFLTTQAPAIHAFAAANRVPTVWGHAAQAGAGGLISYGADYVDIYAKAAVYAARIAKGARPRDLPIEQPSSFELVINLKTAKSLGIKIPPSILVSANQVIQ